MMPQLLATAAMSSLMESGGGGGMQTVSWSLAIWKGGRALRLGDVAGGRSAAGGGGRRDLEPDALPRQQRVRAVGSGQHVRSGFDVKPGRRQWFLRSATLGAPAVRPGGTLHARVEIERWRGERRTRRARRRGAARAARPGATNSGSAAAAEFERNAASRLPGRYRPISLEDGMRRMSGAAALRRALRRALGARARGDARRGGLSGAADLGARAAGARAGDRRTRSGARTGR